MVSSIKIATTVVHVCMYVCTCMYYVHVVHVYVVHMCTLHVVYLCTCMYMYVHVHLLHVCTSIIYFKWMVLQYPCGGNTFTSRKLRCPVVVAPIRRFYKS